MLVLCGWSERRARARWGVLWGGGRRCVVVRACVVVASAHSHIGGWLLLGPVGSISHMRLCARFVLLKMIRTKKIKISGTPRALFSISFNFNNQLLILRTKNREAELKKCRFTNYRI
jgi:hypothetical protein